MACYQDNENTFTYNGYTVHIEQDTDVESPDQYGDNGLFLVTTRNRHFELLHDSKDAQALIEDKGFCKRYWVFPVRAYIHSGVALSLYSEYPFDDQWDSGQIGFVFCAKSEWRYRERNTRRGASARRAAEVYVIAWNQYLNDDVWRYSIQDWDGTTIDSCGGMYGYEYCKAEAIAAVPVRSKATAKVQANG
jgi:hypothetical protein